GLGSSATKDVGTTSGNVLGVGSFRIGIRYSPGEAINFSSRSWNQGEHTYVGPTNSSGWPVGVPSGYYRISAMAGRDSGTEYTLLMFSDSAGGDLYYASSRAGNFIGRKVLTNGNTTVDSNGFVKSASPIVKIFRDGKFETNDESEGCTVTRMNTGEYLIEGCMGLNSDAAWGGIDGGFDIPKDRNGQALIWLDYEVSADGSVLVKTFHREYPTAPAFARNSLEGLVDGDPVDIPADQYVSVRVEMPQNSIWNQRAAKAEVSDSSSD
ncbi:phage tail protein, partial [Enterobacter cloacae complex sp. IR5379]